MNENKSEERRGKMRDLLTGAWMMLMLWLANRGGTARGAFVIRGCQGLKKKEEKEGKMKEKRKKMKKKEELIIGSGSGCLRGPGG